MGSRPADLVFAPTPACGMDRLTASPPLPARSPPPGQGLHLNRAMLSDQGSPYVGRFARGWHRLPGSDSPGNHRPEREPIGEYIGASSRGVDAARGRGVSARAAVSRQTCRAPPRSSADAQAEAVAPVVSTSSTSSTAPGGGVRARNRPCIAASRPSRSRLAWVERSSPSRARSGATGSPRRRPTTSASARAWSKPRSAARRRESGTHVTTSSGVPVSGPASVQARAIASPSASATGRQPENFRR